MSEQETAAVIAAQHDRARELVAAGNWPAALMIVRATGRKLDDLAVAGFVRALEEVA